MTARRRGVHRGPLTAGPRPWPRRLGGLLVWVGLGAVLAVALAVVVVPRAMGWVPLTILSGSMEPTIPVGSQVVVEPVAGEEQMAHLLVGDVVTFMPRPDDPTLVTHRVISRSERSDGTALVTQGDANDSPDRGPITATQVRGVVRYHVPYAGYVARMLDPEQKRTGMLVVAVGLFGYAAAQLAGAARDRAHRHGARGAGEIDRVSAGRP